MKKISLLIFISAAIIYSACSPKKSDDTTKTSALLALARSSSASSSTSTASASCLSLLGSSTTVLTTAEITANSACTTPTFGANTPAWITANFKCNMTTSVSGNTITISAITSQPPYKSSYYATTSANYESTMPTGNAVNPNKISAQNNTITMPLSPTVNTTTTASSMGPIGVNVVGVVLYNNAAAPGDSLTTELATMDRGYGHPTNTGSYHNHTEPCKITNNDSNLVGVMMDGFPVIGQKDADGTTPTDLDAAHGHSTKALSAALVAGGAPTYHYHITATDPYILSVFRGTPGTAK
jgi:hypothetical protein